MNIRLISVLLTVLTTTCALAAQPVALFDQAHGQRFVIEKSGELNLGALASALASAGFQVRSTDKPLTAQSLTGVKALITSGGFVPFSAQENEAVGNFLKGGGNLAVMLHIAPSYETLLTSLGITASSGVVHETENVEAINSLDFKVADLDRHPLFDGIGYFSIYGGWAIVDHADTALIVARTSKAAWIDLNRNKVRDERIEPLTMLGMCAVGTIGSGRFAIFGDDAIFQDRYFTGNNAKLGANLAKWLLEGK